MLKLGPIQRRYRQPVRWYLEVQRRSEGCQTYRAEIDETTGLEEKIITDSKNKAMVPSCDVIDANGEYCRYI